MQLSPRTEDYGTTRPTPFDSAHGLDRGKSVTIDIANLDPTHVSGGELPAGYPLAIETATGRGRFYTDAGVGALRGVLVEPLPVGDQTSGLIHGSVTDIAILKAFRLPVDNTGTLLATAAEIRAAAASANIAVTVRD